MILFYSGGENFEILSIFQIIFGKLKSAKSKNNYTRILYFYKTSYEKTFLFL